jgi:uridine phosphorylase
MIRFKINEEFETTTDLVNALTEIVDLIKRGYIRGHNPNWQLEDTTERDKKIKEIKRILGEWGMTTTAEMELESSPVYHNTNGSVCSLIEEFTQSYVRVVTYNDELIIDESDVEYEELSDELIDEIHTIMEQYDIAQNKLHDSIRNEDF